MSFSCTLTWAAVLITLPVILLLHATQSRPNRIRRMRQQGSTWATIATRYGVSPSTIRRWATA
jgi:DNA invertase Pin-like site-specific DNA recombinase